MHAKRLLVDSPPALALLTSLMIFGCEQDKRLPATPTASDDVPFNTQVSHVLNGESDEIRLEYDIVTDADVQQIDSLSGLRTLVLDGGSISDTGMASIGKCGDLEHLRLRKSPITDAGLQHIASLASLRILNLPHSACSATGIKVLQSLPHLHQLRIGSLVAGSNICEPLSKCQSLRALHLINIPINDDDLLKLVKIETLESLYVDGGFVTDDGWAQLFEERPDLHVHLDQKHHDLDPGKHP